MVLVIEDLHWGDVPSVRVLDSALRNLASRPLFVLALARPEVSELFPSLWSERGLVSIALSPLSKRAAAELARAALGEHATEGAVTSLVARAQGNAFFLEELIRGAARGDAALPDSIFGVLQARLDALPADARQVLRAASIFGDSFTLDNAVALLGGMLRETVEFRLLTLARAEIVTSVSGVEYRFRHALVRDAAYATLTDDDRKLGHKLAGELLEATGGAGALVLAEHFVRGGTPERAIAHLRLAATKSLEGNDLRGAVAFADRALALQPARADLGVAPRDVRRGVSMDGRLRSRGSTRARRDRRARRRHRVVVFRGRRVSSPRARTGAISSARHRSSRPCAARKRTRATRATRRSCASRAAAPSSSKAVSTTKPIEIVRELRAEPPANVDDNARGWMHWLFAMRSLRDGDLATFAKNTEATLAAFERIGEIRNTSSQRINLGYAYAELGAFDRAEPLLRRVQQDAERVGIPMVVAYALQNLGNVLRSLGRLEEAREQERRATAIGESIGDRRIEGASRAYGALMMLELGDAAGAESQCSSAIASLQKNPPLLGFAKAVLARTFLARGRNDEAAVQSSEALAIVAGGVEDGETFIRLTHIQTLEACGDIEGARALALEAEGRLLARAARIQDDALRTSFLERVPESAHTLAAAARLR